MQCLSTTSGDTLLVNGFLCMKLLNKLCGFQSESKLYRASNCHQSVNFSANSCGCGGVMWSAWQKPHYHYSQFSRLEPQLFLSSSTSLILSFLDQSHYFFFQVAPHLSSQFSRPEPLLFLSSSSSLIFARLGGPYPRPTASQKIW
jgi:hypothetical protein